MGIYHLAQICKNGHVINTCADIHPERNQKYCEKCGALTITHCENCGDRSAVITKYRAS